MSHAIKYGLYGLLSGGGLIFLIWLAVRTARQSEDPVRTIFKFVLTAGLILGDLLFIQSTSKHLGSGMGGDFGAGFLIAGSIVVCGLILSVFWTPHLVAFLSSPLTSIFDGGNEPPEPKPQYSAALARHKVSKPLEAIVLIREQLARFPHDFEGVMLLANIQAEDLNDLPGAELTLNHFVSQPGAPERQVVAALTQLADWHLKKAADVDSARAALQQIVARFPETEAALRAEQRLAHLGETEKLILARHDRQSIAVPEGVKNIGLLASSAFLQPQEIEPGKLAAAYVKHLQQHPHDAEVRQNLATIYARDFHRLDLAAMELTQLINEPRYAPKQVAGWLNLLANFQVELGADEAEVRATLTRILEDFPDSPMAEQTARRLARLASEFKGKKETPNVKLGVYEQNIGLKYGSPRKL